MYLSVTVCIIAIIICVILREYIESGGTFKRGESPDFSKTENKILYKTLRKKYGI